MRQPALDLVGKDTLKQLPALLERGRAGDDARLRPDAHRQCDGHQGARPACGRAIPRAAGRIRDRRYCVDRYDDAARKYLGKPASQLRWGTKIEHAGVMDLITVDDAIAAFERYCADTRGHRRR